VDGKKKYKYSKKQSVVREWLLAQRDALRDGVFVKDESIRFGDFLDTFLRDSTASLRPATVEYYNWCIPKHIKPSLGNIKLSDLKPLHLQRFYTQKLEEGLSNSAVRHFHNIIHKALQAARWGLVTRNVSDLVNPPSLTRSVPVVWTQEEAKKFLNYIKGSRYEGIFVLALSTGMRRGEILGLQYQDINWKTGTIQVSRSLGYYTRRGFVISEPKTEGSKRKIVVPRFALEVLKDHVESHNVKSGFVFTTSNGTPFSPRNIIRYFESAMDNAGVPRISFHKLRHTFATLHLTAGTNPKVVQRYRPQSVSLTLSTYS
jgi:integrase